MAHQEKNETIQKEMSEQVKTVAYFAREYDIPKRQEEATVSALHQIFDHHCCGNPTKYEFKSVTLEKIGKNVFMATTFGRKGDERTYAEVFCRDHRVLVIGPRGALILLNPAGRAKKKFGRAALYTTTK